MLEKMNEFFNLRSEVYEEKHLAGIDGGVESKDMLAGLLPEGVETLLDIGIGTGLELKEIFKRFPEVKVSGMDISQGMIDVLHENYPDKNMDIKLESYFDYDFGEERFDAAMSVMTLHHYTHDVKTELYKRIYKSIKQGGVYLESDYIIAEKEGDEAQKLEDFFFAEYERLKAEQDLNGAEEYHYDTPCTVDNQIKMLEAAGFSKVERVWSKKNTVVLKAYK